MKVAVKRYWTRGEGYNSVFNEEMSVPTHEIDDQTAIKLMAFYEAQGLKKCENSTQYFYTKIINCNESVEYIFYKKQQWIVAYCFGSGCITHRMGFDEEAEARAFYDKMKDLPYCKMWKY